MGTVASLRQPLSASHCSGFGLRCVRRALLRNRAESTPLAKRRRCLGELSPECETVSGSSRTHRSKGERVAYAAAARIRTKYGQVHSASMALSDEAEVTEQIRAQSLRQTSRIRAAHFLANAGDALAALVLPAASAQDTFKVNEGASIERVPCSRCDFVFFSTSSWTIWPLDTGMPLIEACTEPVEQTSVQLAATRKCPSFFSGRQVATKSADGLGGVVSRTVMIAESDATPPRPSLAVMVAVPLPIGNRALTFAPDA